MDAAFHAGDEPEEQAAARLLAVADGLRDQRAWQQAANAYADYLRCRPDEWQIWVQYGHCMKEAGDPRAALLLYREAERLAPEDADLHVQIGHALKLLGRREEARAAYAHALALEPANVAAATELAALDQPAQPAQLAPEAAPEAPRAAAGQGEAAPVLPDATAPGSAPASMPGLPQPLAFDASDLLDYCRANRAPTGIQRVQLNIIREALQAPGGAATAITAFDQQAGCWKALPHALFQRLAALTRSGADVADPEWRAVTAEVTEALQQAPPMLFSPGCALVNLGTSWWIPDYLRRVRDLKALHGLRYIPFVHDCIPLLVPEHCAAGLVQEFARWFASVCLHADAVLANSECTRSDFMRLQQALVPGLEIPTHVIRLDAADPPAPPAPEVAQAVRALRGGRPYVLFVGTIESRKNHLMVFRAWQRLVREMGPEAAPDLVCVGKRGWLAEPAMQLHAASPVLQGKVQLLTSVPDTLLEALYDGCLFTLGNSFYEGWGLPVTESLAHGKVPLLPAHSALTESGGEAALYFTPGDEDALLDGLRRLLDPAFRAAREARLAELARPRTWAALTAQLLQVVEEAALAPALPPPDARLPLRLAETAELRLLPGTQPDRAMALADILREGEGWSVPEPWGSWTLPQGRSLLRLPLAGRQPGDRLRIYLELTAPPAPCRFGLRVIQPGQPPAPFRTVDARADEEFFCVLLPEPAEAGPLLLEFDAMGGTPLPGTGQRVGIGLRSVMACREEDFLTRIDYLERKSLRRVLAV